MSAKKMFEELGFPNYSVDYKKDKIACITYYDDDGSKIKITPGYVEYVHKYSNWKVQIKHLPAINKQIEELGWNND